MKHRIMSLKVLVTIYNNGTEQLFEMKEAPRVGEYLSINHILFRVKNVWWNLNNDPKMKYDVRVLVREE